MIKFNVKEAELLATCIVHEQMFGDYDQVYDLFVTNAGDLVGGDHEHLICTEDEWKDFLSKMGRIDNMPDVIETYTNRVIVELIGEGWVLDHPDYDRIKGGIKAM